MILQLAKPAPPNDDKRWKLVDVTMRRSGYASHALIETLHRVQDLFGYLDEPAMHFVAESLGLPFSKVYGVATFYHLFTLKPQGQAHLRGLHGHGLLHQGSAASCSDAIRRTYRRRTGADHAGQAIVGAWGPAAWVPAVWRRRPCWMARCWGIRRRTSCWPRIEKVIAMQLDELNEFAAEGAGGGGALRALRAGLHGGRLPVVGRRRSPRGLTEKAARDRARLCQGRRLHGAVCRPARWWRCSRTRPDAPVMYQKVTAADDAGS